MATEAHVQGIARFVVGFGTEEDEHWRDYHFDFCGHIDYDPATGAPLQVHPVEKSGYSVGCLQLDFGQTTAAAEPFVAAFDAWHKANPGSEPLVSTHAFAIKALTSDGATLHNHPTRALHQQDVAALSAFVLSPAGSDWVNQHIDNALIGSDAQRKSVYNGEWSLVGIAREMEARAAFKAADEAKHVAMTDLLYTMTMKAYNQNPRHCTKEFLPFLDTSPSEQEIIAWPNKYSGAFRDGVNNAVDLSRMWSALITPTAKWTPPAWLLAVRDLMDEQALSNPRTTSASSGGYVAARQAFEASGWFPAFVQALQAGKDYFPKGLFDLKTGAIVVVPETNRVHQGVMAKNDIGYVWDTAGDAYQLKNGAWSPIAIDKINRNRTLFEVLRAFLRNLVPMS
jgi:hypothetical protein